VDIHNTVPPSPNIGGTRPPCPIGIDAPGLNIHCTAAVSMKHVIRSYLYYNPQVLLGFIITHDMGAHTDDGYTVHWISTAALEMWAFLLCGHRVV